MAGNDSGHMMYTELYSRTRKLTGLIRVVPYLTDLRGTYRYIVQPSPTQTLLIQHAIFAGELFLKSRNGHCSAEENGPVNMTPTIK